MPKIVNDSNKQNIITPRDWRRIEYFVPITKEAFSNSDGTSHITIRGTAINECTTRNGITYTSEELAPSANTLTGRPILKDHINSVDAIVGKVVASGFSVISKKVDFEAMIDDSSMCSKIDKGLITSVSVGAMVREIEKGEDGSLTARGIEFVELSLVAVPADPNANFERALMESYDMKNTITESVKDVITQNIPESSGQIKEQKEIEETLRRKNKMDEQNNNVQLEEKARVLAEQNSTLQKQLEEFKNKEMEALRQTYKALATEKGVNPREGYEKLNSEVLEAMIETLKSIKVLETKKEVETPKAESKGQVTESKEEVKSDLKFEKTEYARGLSFYSTGIAAKHPVFARQ